MRNLEAQKKKPVVVIVDDEEEILMSLRSLFRKSGYDLHLFTSGGSALEFLKATKADVIISDMRMPEMSGSEFLEKAIGFSTDSVRIIISGFEEKSVVLNAVAKGYARYYIMKPWNDEELKTLVEEGLRFKEGMCKKHLEKLLYKFDNLPSPPRVYHRLIEILQKDIQSQKDIAIEIEKNPTLVARLLRISNSIYYGVRKEVTTVSEAIAFIGTESVLNIVIGLESFSNLYQGNDEEITKESEELRIKSVQRAHLSRKIASLWNEKINPHEAYIAGLMLDIGMLFRFSLSAESFHEYIKIYRLGGKSPYAIEKELFEVMHDEIGEILLTYWNFAESIINAVANHHSNMVDDDLSKIVQVADYLLQGDDSLPHDPSNEISAEELKPQLEKFLEDIKNANMF